MDENRSKAGWPGAREEKWRKQLAGMEAMLAPVDEPLIRALRLDAAYRIAEAGCGGGGTALELVRRAPAGSVVHGFDISPTLIDVARGRGAGMGALAFDVADMATAAPLDAPYERLVSRFGVMFFADPSSAFRNMAGWLASGGRFAFAVWGRLADNPWMSIVRETVAEIVTLPEGEPDAPGPFRYGDGSKLLPLLERAGFGDLELSDWRGDLPIGGALSAGEAAEFTLAAFASFSELLSEAGDGALGSATEKLARRLSAYQQGGGVRMGACVHIVTGTGVNL